MLETLSTIVITAASVLLFAYWFRYTCVLILSARTTQDYAADFAASNQLVFPDVQNQLLAGTANLAQLQRALDRDYAAICYMLKTTGEGQESLETKMLAMNYRMMSTWYSISSSFSPSAARHALNEMSAVVSHFANSLGERAAYASAA